MPEESKQQIMEATYTALCKHGYADLSIQKIADESDKGKSLIYYHYDDKEDLMLAFLDYMGDHIKRDHIELEDAAPEEKLDNFLDMALGVEDDEQWEFHKAFLEVRAQAPHSPKFAEKFKQIDSLILNNITEMLEELDVEEPDITSDILVSCIEGTVIRKVSTGDRDGLEALKNSIKGIVEQHIVKGCEKQ
jgi:AcrR family transcriptional regulator